MSDSRLLRSQRQRALLWYAAQGRCKLCSAALDPANWHADHIVPYVRSRRTNWHEMQALCPSCNLKKGAQS
jgi:5-methylcytosine-specific restriction endonuclease McrA